MLFSKHEGCMLVRGEVNSELLWQGPGLSVFRLVVSARLGLEQSA